MKSKFIHTILFLLVAMFANLAAKACVVDTTIITTVVSYDAAFNEVEIRLGNLKLGAETPNTFCSCALTSWSTMFTNLQYVIFVEAGTNNPYTDFGSWNTETAASNSWNAQQPSYGNWEGFIAEVINQGLVPNTPVEMVIRASLPAGYNLVVLDSSISTTHVGTDKWDHVNQTLEAAHQKVRNLNYDASSVNYITQPLSYFTSLDSSITVSTERLKKQPFTKVVTMPNPFQDQLRVSFNLKKGQDITLKIVSIDGRELLNKDLGRIEEGLNQIKLDLSEDKWTMGIYFLMIHTAEGQVTKKIVRTAP